MPIAVVTFQFDPYAHLFGDLTIRWGAIALAGVIVAALLLAGLLARADGLRMDDVAFVAVGVVPGAVVGGRLGYLIVHAGYYGATPERLLDPSIGSLELGLAVVGGILTGSYVASLLGASVGRWQYLARLPVTIRPRGRQAHHGLTGTGAGASQARQAWPPPVSDRDRGARSCRACRRCRRRRSRGSPRW